MSHPRGRKDYLSEAEWQAVDQFHRQLQGALGQNLKALRLFGSKVHGFSTAASDIDLLVLVERYLHAVEDSVIDIAFDVNVKYNVYISPRVIAEATLKHPVWRVTPFLRAVSKESVAL